MIKIYTDGVFDFAHSGHLNAIRQARGLGEYLCVGVNEDSDVAERKGQRPLIPCAERALIIAHVKWVDRVLFNAPYVTRLRTLVDVARCDFAAHGDDVVVTTTGEDCYAETRATNKYKTFKRTEGISSTEVCLRMAHACADLQTNYQSHQQQPPLALQRRGKGGDPQRGEPGDQERRQGGEGGEGGEPEGGEQGRRPALETQSQGPCKTSDSWRRILDFQTPPPAATETSSPPGGEDVEEREKRRRKQRMNADIERCDDNETSAIKVGIDELRAICNITPLMTTTPLVAAPQAPAENRGIDTVYTQGAFDVLRGDAVWFLRDLKTRCDRLIVGVLNDQACRDLCPECQHLPIMAEPDRILSVMALSPVDEVLPHAVPWTVDLKNLPPGVTRVILPGDSTRVCVQTARWRRWISDQRTPSQPQPSVTSTTTAHTVNDIRITLDAVAAAGSANFKRFQNPTAKTG